MVTPAFLTPDWAAVLEDSRTDAARAQDALTRLCRTYWHPLYAYVRMRGYGPEDAQELTHRFFAWMTEADVWGEMSGAQTRARLFFLASLNRFLKGEPPHHGAGGAKAVDQAGAQKLYEENWAIALLNVVYDRLRFEYESADKGEIFEALKFSLTARNEGWASEDLTRRLGVAESTLKMLATRLRQRYAEILREEAAHIVVSSEEVDDELKYLSLALG
jgi:RNA polymerase sigma-70 factor (ECF subfamily)